MDGTRDVDHHELVRISVVSGGGSRLKHLINYGSSRPYAPSSFLVGGYWAHDSHATSKSPHVRSLENIHLSRDLATKMSGPFKFSGKFYYRKLRKNVIECFGFFLHVEGFYCIFLKSSQQV